ncbi:MAG: hypothetical protein ABEJ84_04610 [Halodesulfurarchaeum sp.]
MSRLPLPESNGVTTYLEDGARIAAILLVWGIIAAFFTSGVGTVGYPNGPFARLGASIGAVVAVAGLLNAVLYVLYRAIDYWHQF